MRTMGFQGRTTLHIDVTGPTEDAFEMADQNPAKIQNDLPDVEQRVAEKKSSKEHDAPIENPELRHKEAAVEEAIEKLPAS